MEKEGQEQGLLGGMWVGNWAHVIMCRDPDACGSGSGCVVGEHRAGQGQLEGRYGVRGVREVTEPLWADTVSGPGSGCTRWAERGTSRPELYSGETFT